MGFLWYGKDRSMKRLKQLACSFLIAFLMYSKIPMPNCEWKKENMRYVMCFFPMIGVAIGAGVEILLYILFHTKLQGSLFASILLLVFPIIVTGGIHMDGLLDTFDAFFSYGTKEKRLEILKDSRAGAFAVLGCGIYLLLYLGILDFLAHQLVQKSSPGWLIICLGFSLSRTLSGLAVITFPKAKDTGLAAMFSDEAQKKHTFLVLLIFLIAEIIGLFWIHKVYALMVCILCGMFYFYYYHMSKKTFGGITGDLAGWFLQICELIIAFGVLITYLMIGGH